MFWLFKADIYLFCVVLVILWKLKVKPVHSITTILTKTQHVGISQMKQHRDIHSQFVRMKKLASKSDCVRVGFKSCVVMVQAH